MKSLAILDQFASIAGAQRDDASMVERARMRIDSRRRRSVIRHFNRVRQFKGYKVIVVETP